jgi:hypothetical protein
VIGEISSLVFETIGAERTGANVSLREEKSGETFLLQHQRMEQQFL